ncbi:glucose-6-phosphate dehydrogenase [Anaerotalea alkaliphila]|uniref:Glucose-6-phosphate 1-dehydrogenase n=1 Tax=Anaerotalea alkaliphila TaxID=2662126 RepID=A0A7X5HVV7_9FIRM|nr:glucose-6-phosphate dehydrogenase [Anaerotalea alkaliphila]NDL67605.1 glucose-6-phosphate dehydrogenase [Anaerotalea alkaliphila]
MELSNLMVIFGGTGDLTYRKLIPALYNLQHEGLLPENFVLVSVGRRDKTTEEYLVGIEEGIRGNARFPFEEEQWNRLKARIHYYRLPFEDDEAYPEFDNYLCTLEHKYATRGNRMFYLAVAPEYFSVIVDKLQKNGLVREVGAWSRVVIEKPFGKDFASAKELSRHITHVFGEENTYRIDHYLGKEMLQNIMVIRFANAFFEPVWNNKHIDHIQISSTETLGVGDRGGYYENSGALKDMVQNHLLQLLAVTTMEPPIRLDTESIRDEKVKVFKGLKELDEDLVVHNVVRGQYVRGIVDGQEVPGYREEDRVADGSDTETFVALKVEIQNFRWSGVPIYIRTGKRMHHKSIEVSVQFKEMADLLYMKGYQSTAPNMLVIRIQPYEGVSLQFNAKKPGTTNEMVPVKMDFCQNCEIGYSSPEAYERLLFDVMKGDSTLFTRWDEVEYSWRYVDRITQAWAKNKPAFPNYQAGSEGPREAMDLLARDGRKWWTSN